jgi:hypothetical protein
MMPLLFLVTKLCHSFVTFPSDERKEVEVACPVEGMKFKAYEVVVSNPWGGRDYDNCPHALKTTPAGILETASTQAGLSAPVRELLAVAQRLSPAAARVLAESARAMEREGLGAGPGGTGC